MIVVTVIAFMITVRIINRVVGLFVLIVNMLRMSHLAVPEETTCHGLAMLDCVTCD
jgi:hypothetical protein